jgi:hypothetical protein
MTASTPIMPRWSPTNGRWKRAKTNAKDSSPPVNGSAYNSTQPPRARLRPTPATKGRTGPACERCQGRRPRRGREEGRPGQARLPPDHQSQPATPTAPAASKITPRAALPSQTHDHTSSGIASPFGGALTTEFCWATPEGDGLRRQRHERIWSGVGQERRNGVLGHSAAGGSASGWVAADLTAPLGAEPCSSRTSPLTARPR